MGDGEEAPVQCAGGRVRGHGGGIAEEPQAAQQDVDDQAADGTDNHGALLTQTGSQQRNGEESQDNAGNHGQGGNRALQLNGAGHAGKHGNTDGAGLGLGTELVRRGRQDQHLDGAVVLEGVPVVLQTDLDSLAGAEEFRAILRGDGDNSHDGERQRQEGGQHPELVEELNRGVVANIGVLVGDVGNDDGQRGEQNGVEHAVEGGEHGALLRVVGQAALCALGDNALAGVAKVEQAAHHEEENKADGTFGQLVGDMEHNVAGHEQDSLTDDDERAVLAELAVGFVNHKADERVGDAVPQAHRHQEAGGNHHADADKAQQVEGDIVHEHQVDVRGGVVQGETGNAPKRNAVDTVGFVVLVVILVRQGSHCSHS